MKISRESLIKLGLAVLLLLCIAPLPYGYIQLVRYAILVGFVVLAYFEFERKRRPMGLLYVGFAVLFQPFVQQSAGNLVWSVIDGVVALLMVLLAFLPEKKEDHG